MTGTGTIVQGEAVSVTCRRQGKLIKSTRNLGKLTCCMPVACRRMWLGPALVQLKLRQHHCATAKLSSNTQVLKWTATAASLGPALRLERGVKCMRRLVGVASCLQLVCGLGKSSSWGKPTRSSDVSSTVGPRYASVRQSQVVLSLSGRKGLDGPAKQALTLCAKDCDRSSTREQYCYVPHSTRRGQHIEYSCKILQSEK